MARDLINTPTNDMGPAELEQAARELAEQHGAGYQGHCRRRRWQRISRLSRRRHGPRARAAADRSHLGQMTTPRSRWSARASCFDTGGLDIKPSSAMLNMKKDMGGAATVLALAHMVMSRGLKVRLRVLVPAVENSVSGDAFRPRDIYRSRKGLTVEIGNTDAEGRLVLADALALADEESRCWSSISARSPARRASRSAPTCRPSTPTTRPGRRHGALLRRPKATRSGGCRCGRLTKPCSNSKIADRQQCLQRRLLPARSPARCSSGASSTAPSLAAFRHFRLDPSAKPGRPEGGECQVARGLYALLRALCIA